MPGATSAASVLLSPWTSAAVALAVGVAAALSCRMAPIVSSLTIAAIVFIALIGLDLFMGYTGQVSLGQVGFMAIGGYTAGYFCINYEVEPRLGHRS